MKHPMERRVTPATELRVSATNGAPVIEGYAARFNSLSEDLGGFRELIQPGAFASAIGTSDIRALFNHDANFVLGRMSAGTLTVKEDAQGLLIRNSPPDTQWARDLMVSMQRGDVTQMSFAFRVETDMWTKNADGTQTRTIVTVAELFDVSPVTYPAYPDTSVAVRSLESWRAASAPAVPGGQSVDLASRRLRLALSR